MGAKAPHLQFTPHTEAIIYLTRKWKHKQQVPQHQSNTRKSTARENVLQK